MPNKRRLEQAYVERGKNGFTHIYTNLIMILAAERTEKSNGHEAGLDEGEGKVGQKRRRRRGRERSRVRKYEEENEDKIEDVEHAQSKSSLPGVEVSGIRFVAA